MKRFWCWLTSHKWEIRSVWVSTKGANLADPLPASIAFSADVDRLVHKFTIVWETCSCGATRSHELLGEHKIQPGGVDAELQELRKML